MSKSKPKGSIYKQVIAVTRVYLGPATERFIDRQIENHLKKTPSKITKSDLVSLIDWIKVVVSLVTEDKNIVEEYINELKKIVEDRKNKPDK
jgi:hypothetical protein